MKITSVVLSAALMLGAVSPVFAQTDHELENVVTEVKERLNVGDFEEFSSDISTVDNEDVYYLTWSDSKETYKYLQVVYSDGVILDYNYSYDGKYDVREEKFPEISREEALKTAQEFVKKANPDIYENLELVPILDMIRANEYYFHILRKENGIYVAGDGGNIGVFKDKKEVSFFYLDYETDVEFLPIDGILTAEAAEEKYVESLPFELQYTYYYDYDKKELKVYPQYFSDNDKVINAVDGTVYKVPEEDDVVYRDQNSTMGKGDGDSGLSEVEQAEIDKISGLISKKDAEKIVRDNKIINVPSDWKLERTSLTRDYIDDEIYKYTLAFENEEYDWITAEVDARTGQILCFYRPGDYSVRNQDLETEKQIAKEALKVFGAEDYAKLRLSENNEAGYVYYERTHNGIPVSENGAYFEFDGADNLVSYSFVKTPIKEFPSVDGIKTEKEAFDSAKEQIDFGLIYMIEEKKGTPVYGFFGQSDVIYFNLNPFTGKRIDYTGEEYKEAKSISYSDIAGHYAEDKFLKLAEFGIGFYDGVLEPDKKITRSEYLGLLTNMLVYVPYDIIDISDTTPLTREQAVVLMVNRMGGAEYLKYDEMFINPFSDVTENKGPIAYLKAIGVVSGDGNGNFNPKNTITRGEALIMIYNYLNR